MTNEQIAAILRQIESNNGQNMNHPLINAGVNAGTHAAGQYGLTQALVNELAKQNSQYNNITTMPWEQQKAYIESHPNVDTGLATQEINKLQQNSQDPRDIAFRWNHGTSLNPANISEQKLASDPYSQKFNTLKAKMGIAPKASTNPIEENLAQQTGKAAPEAVHTPFDEQTLHDFINSTSNPFNQEMSQNNDDEDDEDEMNKKNSAMI